MAEDKKLLPQNRRSTDFRSKYANNVFFETSVFDLKINFGEIERTPDGSIFIEYHSAVTMDWTEAKIAAIFLLVNIFNHEKQYASLTIPPAVLPPFIPADAAGRSLEELLQIIPAKFHELAAKFAAEGKAPKQ